MKKNVKKRIISFVALFVFMVSMVSVIGVNNAHALDTGLNQINSEIDLGNEDPRTVATRVINVAMAFLGIIAVVIILLGGFKWMTAGGSEDKVGEAKKLIGQGVIGLLIVLMSWAIAQFVINQLITATAPTS